MAQHGSVQGVMQVSVLGQFPAGLLDQVCRRLASHAEHQYDLHMVEDVFFRGQSQLFYCYMLIPRAAGPDLFPVQSLLLRPSGIHDPAAALREEDVLRVRHTTLDKTDEWQAGSILPISSLSC